MHSTYQRNENKGINRNNNLRRIRHCNMHFEKKAPTKYISPTPGIVI